MNDKVKYMYHTLCIVIAIFMLIMWVITPDIYPELKTLSWGLLGGWLMQYVTVNLILIMDKNGLIK